MQEQFEHKPELSERKTTIKIVSIDDQKDEMSRFFQTHVSQRVVNVLRKRGEEISIKDGEVFVPESQEKRALTLLKLMREAPVVKALEQAQRHPYQLIKDLSEQEDSPEVDPSQQPNQAFSDTQTLFTPLPSSISFRLRLYEYLYPGLFSSIQSETDLDELNKLNQKMREMEESEKAKQPPTTNPLTRFARKITHPKPLSEQEVDKIIGSSYEEIIEKIGNQNLSDKETRIDYLWEEFVETTSLRIAVDEIRKRIGGLILAGKHSNMIVFFKTNDEDGTEVYRSDILSQTKRDPVFIAIETAQSFKWPSQYDEEDISVLGSIMENLENTDVPEEIADRIYTTAVIRALEGARSLQKNPSEVKRWESDSESTLEEHISNLKEILKDLDTIEPLSEEEIRDLIGNVVERKIKEYEERQD